MNGTADADERGTYLVELTDPFRPANRGFLHMPDGTHQVTVHPDGQHLYNNGARPDSDRTGFIEVYDISGIEERDPSKRDYEIVDVVVLVAVYGSHDMSFSADGVRAYSAAINHSFILDTSDPTNNRVVARIADPAITLHHDAHAVEAGGRNFMLIGDELVGAVVPGGHCPGGGIHVYDVTGALERRPVKVGAIFIPEVRPALDGETGEGLNCTAHVIQPIPEQQLLVVTWYNAGLRVLDYSGLGEFGAVPAPVGASAGASSGIRQVAWARFANSDLWSAKVHPGDFAKDTLHVYGGDQRRSLDVWRVDVAAARARTSDEHSGTWATDPPPSRLASTPLSERAFTCVLPPRPADRA